MKKFLSIILAAAIILSLVPAAFAAGDDAATETPNLKLVYDISGVVNFKNTGAFSSFTEEFTNGFFRFDTANSTSSLITNYERGSYWTCNGFDFRANSSGEKLTVDVYVPVAGNYTITGQYSKYKNAGIVEVYANGAKAGEYDCADATDTSGNSYPMDGTFSFTDIPFNAGWNKVKFSTETSKAGGTVRTFSLILGDGSGYALMGVHEKKLTVGDSYIAETFKSSEISYPNNPPALNNKITEGLTYVSSNTNVAEVSTDGTITAKAYGKATITVSDGTGVPYDIAVSVDDPSMPTIVYDISKVMKEKGISSAAKFLALTAEDTNGFFRANSDCDFRTYTSFQSERGTTSNNGIDMHNYAYVSFDVYVPVAGNYTMTGRHAKYPSGGKVELYVNDAASPVGSYDCYGEGTDNTYSVMANFEIPGIALNKGWNKIKFATPSAGKGTIRTFSLVGGSGNALMPYFDGNTTLEVGETATLKGFLGSNATAATVGYSVEGDCVTVSNDGTIEAEKAGKATVTMTETAGSATVANPYTVDITVVEQDQDLSNAFDDAVVGAAPSGYTAPTVNAIDATGIIDDPVLVSGGAYKITAPEEAAERGAFLYWKKAMSTNERILSFESEFNYVPESDGRNILVAVYEGDVTSDTPKCYNANGQYLPDAQPIDADLPSMAGYGKASAWAQYKETNVYVAQYALEAPEKNIDITVEGGEGTGTYAYGDTVTCTATGDNFKCWKKDGKIVSIDDEYTFKAWEDSTVEAVYQADVYYTGSTFKILIDSFTAGDETGVMAEFIGFGNNVVEKGIMFEDNRIAMTTVGNQFSVIADAEGTYVGYAIVNEDGALKLIIDGSYTK